MFELLKGDIPVIIIYNITPHDHISVFSLKTPKY